LLADSVKSFHNVNVPETHHLEALLTQISRARRIPRGLLDVLAAIEFDNKLERSAAEVSVKGTDRMLAAERRAELLATQMGPEFPFRRSRFCAQAARSLGVLRRA
jgi:hypothetical protein